MLIVNLCLAVVYKPGGINFWVFQPREKVLCFGSVRQLHLSFCEVLLILDSKLRLPDYLPRPPKKKTL